MLKSDVAYQIMWNRLISVVEEQAQALIRTAFSTSVREAGDLSAGVYDQHGRMLAQAVTGTPGHVNAMADAVAHFIRRIGPDNIYEGDIYITNDPWEGTGHLHDIYQKMIRIISGNVSQPDQLIGDIYALASCNEIGHRRLLDMMQEFDLEDLTGIAQFILDHSRRATLEAIAALPRQTAQGALTIDGFDTPITIKAKITIHEDRIVTDFAGSSPVDKKGINCPLVYTKAYACYALKVAIAPEIPNNAASLAPFEVRATENSIVHAAHPAPVALRHIIGHFVPDAVFNAFDQIVPGVVPAEGAGCLCNFQMSLRARPGRDAESGGARFEVLTFNSGGSGARPNHDGLNATAFPSGVMTMPVESTEHAGPVIIWRKELRPDSGGAGKHRGGLGQYMEVGARDGYEFDLQAMLDRVNHPALGRRGAAAGAKTSIAQDNGAVMQGKGKQFVAHNRRVLMAFPGGGG
ncbi:MAG: hydantoinase B/oxoprolinase family protein, partial [Alphaproteobacteria bacterium]